MSRKIKMTLTKLLTSCSIARPTPEHGSACRGEQSQVPALWNPDGKSVTWSVISEDYVCVATELYEDAAKQIVADHERAARAKLGE